MELFQNKITYSRSLRL